LLCRNTASFAGSAIIGGGQHAAENSKCDALQLTRNLHGCSNIIPPHRIHFDLQPA
jgi:hypothetical protein